MLVIITILAMIMIGISLTLIYHKMDVVRAVVWSIVSFVFLYILNSAFLFWIDRFRIDLTCVLILIEAIVVSVFMLMKKRKISITFDYKESLIPAVIFLILLPVVISKFGYFGMGQDQGVYQTKAIALMNGYTKNDMVLDETKDMNPQDQALYKDGISEQYGFYYTGASKPAVQGVFHGINTYPAVLSWWGAMCGMHSMSGINTVLFFCTLIILYDLGKLLKLSKVGRAAVVLLFAISPIILWVVKSSLSENVTILIFLSLIYLILDTDHENMVWLSGIVIAVYAFFHAMIYVMMPLFTILLLAAYVLYGNKKYLIANIIGVISYGFGYLFMSMTSTEYTAGNYGFIERLGISNNNIPLYIAISVAIVVALNIVLMLRPYHEDGVRTFCNYVWLRRLISWTFRIGTIMILLYALKNLRASEFSYVSATMYAYVAATALVVLPFTFIAVFFKTSIIYQSRKLCLMTILFFYTVVIYAAYLSPIVKYYNYYSRYITIFMPFVFAYGAKLYEKLVHVRMKSYTYLAVAGLAIVLYFRYDTFMIRYLDETRAEWSLVEEVTDFLTDQDTAIMQGNVMNQLFFPGKIISGSKMYPIVGDINHTVQLAGTQSENLYYISDMELPLDEGATNQFRLIKTVEYNEKIYDKKMALVGRMPYPLTHYVIPHKVYIYQRETSQNM